MTNSIPKPRHDHDKLTFPEGFLWGAATSAHQVEGNNIYSDWWDWEQTVQPEDKRSGLACDQYNRYKDDFQLAKILGHNAHRLSIEWSRIEPQEGNFQLEEIAHYKDVLKNLKDNGMVVMLTLWHYTLPKWVADIGGWTNRKTASFFIRFIEKILPEVAPYTDFWITLNEPGIYAWESYYAAIRPPQQKSVYKQFLCFLNLARAHKKAYQTIHKKIPDAKVGIAKEVFSFDAFHHHSILENIAEWSSDIIGNHLFYKLTGIKTHDFLGLNYYVNQYISFNGKKKLPSLVDITKTKKEISDMGWEIFPEGIFDIIMDFSDYHLPIYITENGLASTNDDRRARFLISYLKEIYHAIHAGADVKGYFHWSLIDNFEWESGFNPRFGLIEIDYTSQKRTVRSSARIYSEVIQQNGITHKLLTLLGHNIKATDLL